MNNRETTFSKTNFDLMLSLNENEYGNEFSENDKNILSDFLVDLHSWLNKNNS